MATESAIIKMCYNNNEKYNINCYINFYINFLLVKDKLNKKESYI